MHQALPAKTTGEDKIVTFDFVGIVGATGASVSKQILVGNDPTAVGLVLGSPTISGETVGIMVQDGVENCSYVLTCQVSDSSAQIHQSAATITVTSDAI